MNASTADHDRVRQLLGRAPRGRFDVVVRDGNGDPVVLRNHPLLDDGTPMPTRFWLCGPAEVKRIGQLEAAGGVAAAEAAVDATELAAAHARYAAERDREVPADHTGPRPHGGVGGTRAGVKCLHAHWAWHLAGGDDPVGRWVARQLDEGDTSTPHVHIGPTSTIITWSSGTAASVPYGAANLTERWLVEDPPLPESLTNALGAIDDHLDDIERTHPDLASAEHLVVGGPSATALARLEIGATTTPAQVELGRDDAEEIFRIVATDTRADRHHHPGLPSGDVDTIVATCIIVLAHMRRLGLGSVTLDTTVPSPPTAGEQV